jgi:hypothetical protein
MLFHDFVKDFLMIIKIPNTPPTRFSFSSKKKLFITTPDIDTYELDT